MSKTNKRQTERSMKFQIHSINIKLVLKICPSMIYDLVKKKNFVSSSLSVGEYNQVDTNKLGRYIELDKK